jgi:hypothetical protein
MGALAALLARDASTVPLPVLLLGWCVLGMLHGPLLWPLLAERAWWTTSYVWYAGVIVVAIASAGWGGAHAVFLAPLVALWLAGMVCWRFTPKAAMPGCCRACDYDLRGLTTPRCPECGTAFGGNKKLPQIRCGTGFPAGLEGMESPSYKVEAVSTYPAPRTTTAPQSGCPA